MELNTRAGLCSISFVQLTIPLFAGLLCSAVINANDIVKPATNESPTLHYTKCNSALEGNCCPPSNGDLLHFFLHYLQTICFVGRFYSLLLLLQSSSWLFSYTEKSTKLLLYKRLPFKHPPSRVLSPFPPLPFNLLLLHSTISSWLRSSSVKYPATNKIII